MKANELRIGNIVRFRIEDSVSHIEGINLHFFSTSNYDIDILIAPVPLTEEWLLRFGFKRWGSYTHLWKVGRNHICTIEEEEEYKGGREWYQFRGRSGYIMEIKYVHQLQNLYFALTGEELTIEE